MNIATRHFFSCFSLICWSNNVSEQIWRLAVGMTPLWPLCSGLYAVFSAEIGSMAAWPVLAVRLEKADILNGIAERQPVVSLWHRFFIIFTHCNVSGYQQELLRPRVNVGRRSYSGPLHKNMSKPLEVTCSNLYIWRKYGWILTQVKITTNPYELLTQTIVLYCIVLYWIDQTFPVGCKNVLKSGADKL